MSAAGAPAMPAARVLLVDDHREVRAGVRALLATEPTLTVVGEASSSDEALGIALVLRPDLIVLDHEMPGTRGLQVLPKLRVILPGVRVVMFTMSSGIASQARLLGADAVVAKDDLTGLVVALRRSAATRAEPRTAVETRRAWANSGWRRTLILPALVLIYVGTFLPLSRWLGDQTLDLAILLVAAAGALYGLRGGVIGAVLAFPVNVVLIRVAGISDSVTGSPTRVLIALAIGAAVGRLRDVTAAADAQARSLADTSAALEASDRRLLGLVEHAPVLLVSVDPGGVIVDALGEGFGDHPRFSPELMRGQQAAVFYGDNPELLARLSRALSGEEVSERVERYGFVYDVYLRPKRDAAGAVTGTTVVLVNVSRRFGAERSHDGIA
jgi:CheY-like chemotaxis protein